MLPLQCIFQGELCAISELEKQLGFSYLSQIDFETVEDRQEIRARGLALLAEQGVEKKSIELGQQFSLSIKNALIPFVSIRWLGDPLGWGLFAEEEIGEGSFVGEYTGIVRQNNRRYFAPINHYCYRYPVLDEIGRDFVIDATQGNVTRFINHSSVPNLQPVHVFDEGFYHLIFLSLRPIQRGEQFCYDYGRNYWSVRDRPISLPLKTV